MVACLNFQWHKKPSGFKPAGAFLQTPSMDSLRAVQTPHLCVKTYDVTVSIHLLL